MFKTKNYLKRSATIMLLVLFIILCSTNSFATLIYAGGPTNDNFNQFDALMYAYDYTETPNPAYKYYSDGGDCTNFASQVLYAAGMPMKGSVGYIDYANWYYNNPNIITQVSNSWINAEVFKKYWAQDLSGVGARNGYALYTYSLDEAINSRSTIINSVATGCIIQLVKNGESYHSMIVNTAFMMDNGLPDLEISQHSTDKFSFLFETLNSLRNGPASSRPDSIAVIKPYDTFYWMEGE